MPSGMSGNCPSLRLSTPASLFKEKKKKSREEKLAKPQRLRCNLCGGQFRPRSALHGFAQLLLTHTGRLPTLQSWPGSDGSLLGTEKTPGASASAFHRQPSGGCRAPSGGCGRNYYPVCLKCWFCSRWMTATCTNSTFDSWRSNLAPDWKADDSLT